MNKSRMLGLFCAAVLGVITLPSQAALIPVLGGQAYYDDVAELTWLANANVNGLMTWQAAKDWAAALDIDGNPGADGWRLPDTMQPDSSCVSQSAVASFGYNCTGSEMGNLFYNVLGGVANTPITTTHNSNYDLFSNVQSYYWSSTEYAPNPINAWNFYFGGGSQYLTTEADSIYAWAVQSGNPYAVPLPAALWLFGSGLLGLVGIARRKKTD